jgi:RNA polymerase sigma-70 factor (ECF subfamily)
VSFLFFFSPSSGADNDEVLPRRVGLLGRRETELPLDHPDRPLVLQVRAGDPEALNALVEHYFVPLARFASSLVDSYDVAEDVAQGVFFRVWSRRQTWTPRAGIRAYLFTAVRNSALDIRRHQQVTTRLEPFLAHERPRTVHPDDPDDVTEERQRVREAIHGLTERQRTALRLRYEVQLPAREIAVILGVSTRAIERLLSRALLVLREALERPAGDG